ncbi:MAG: acetyl-CoA carboxylase biotin carboxyl carrier protein [Ignavibacteria bacterium]
MDLELIKKLVRLIDTSGVTDFSIEEGDVKIKIAKKAATQPVYSQAVLPQNFNTTPPSVAPSTTVGVVSEKKEEKSVSNLHKIYSPIVGTFYRSSGPEAEPFVKVGDMVSSGQTLCIIEAMKLMNEIESDVNGKVVKIMVDNGRPVEYNQPLFLIEI